jgi:hypothetical protein
VSFRHPDQIQQHDQFFRNYSGIDTFLVQTGLHDAWHDAGKGPEQAENFRDNFDHFWTYLSRKIKELRGPDKAPPDVIWRFNTVPAVKMDNTTIVSPVNPSSIELYNQVERDYLTKWDAMQKDRNPIRLSYLDNYDQTWSWHFDDECNERMHYGR